MSFVLISQQIKDFDAWQPEFHKHLSERRGAGLIDLHVLRDEDDPNNIVLLFGTADVKRAKEFIDSDTLRNAMKTAGVIGEPKISFLNESW